MNGSTHSFIIVCTGLSYVIKIIFPLGVKTSVA